MSFSTNLFLGEGSMMEGRQGLKESFWAVPCYKVGVSKFFPLFHSLPAPVLSSAPAAPLLGATVQPPDLVVASP